MLNRLLLTLSVLTAFVCAVPASAHAATEKKTEKTEKKEDKAGRPIPFVGKVTNVDAAAKSFSLKGKEKDRVFSVTEQTVITKDGMPADLSAIPVGEQVRGSAKKIDGAWQAIKVLIGAKDGAKGKKDKSAAPATPAPATAKATPAPATDADTVLDGKKEAETK